MTARKTALTQQDVLDYITAKDGDGGATYAGLCKFFRNANMVHMRAHLRALLGREQITARRLKCGDTRYERVYPCPALAMLYAPPMKQVVQGTRYVAERMASWSGRRGQAGFFTQSPLNKA